MNHELAAVSKKTFPSQEDDKSNKCNGNLFMDTVYVRDSCALPNDILQGEPSEFGTEMAMFSPVRGISVTTSMK